MSVRLAQQSVVVMSDAVEPAFDANVAADRNKNWQRLASQRFNHFWSDFIFGFCFVFRLR